MPIPPAPIPAPIPVAGTPVYGLINDVRVGLCECVGEFVRVICRTLFG